MSIMVATDGQQHSEKAVRFAIELARCRKTPLVILHVITGKRGADNERIIKDGLLLVDKIKDVASAYGVAATGLLDAGVASDLILARAQENECDVIVLGSPGQAPEGAGKIGSVPEYVVHNSKCTVIVIR